MSYIMFLSHCQINFKTIDKMMCYNEVYAVHRFNIFGKRRLKQWNE